MAKRDGIFERNGHLWISFQDIHGKRKKQKTNAATVAEARDIRNAELVKIQKAKALGFIPPTEKGFDVIAKEYLQEQETRLTPDIYTRVSDIFRLHLTPYFSGQLASINHGKIANYLTKRHRDGAAPATQRKELQVLKNMLAFCVVNGYLPSSPAAHVKGPRVPEKEAEFIPKDKSQKMWNECPEWLRPIVMFAVATGFRRRNILGIEWRDINLETRVATLRGTKTADLQYFQLNDTAMAVLRFLLMGNAKTLANSRTKIFHYPGSETNVSVAFKRAAKRAGITNVHFHSLRHTFASWAVMNGSDLYTVQKMLGHKTPRMTARYAHLSPAFMRKEMEILNGAFADLPSLSGDATGTNEDGKQSQ